MILKPKKSLGQNFLVDDNILDIIANLGNINKNSTILEIGPGTGNLTEEYVNINQKRVLSVLNKLESYNLNELRYYDYLLDKLKAANPEFKPEKPKEWEKNSLEWLDTNNIEDVLSQYEKKHSNFDSGL